MNKYNEVEIQTAKNLLIEGPEYICLPRLKKGTMYKGMESDHRYTLEEIGL